MSTITKNKHFLFGNNPNYIFFNEIFKPVSMWSLFIVSTYLYVEIINLPSFIILEYVDRHVFDPMTHTFFKKSKNNINKLLLLLKNI